MGVSMILPSCRQLPVYSYFLWNDHFQLATRLADLRCSEDALRTDKLIMLRDFVS